MIQSVKNLVPQSITTTYHHLLARLAALFYRFPGNELKVIGVTGTNGKSSTVFFIAQLLEELGETVGYTSTAGFYIAGQTIENRLKMTMPGRFVLQKLLRQMVSSGCSTAIIETSSQGLAQGRHIGINYDIALITNLTPEHIESHGGFDNYKRAKGLLFNALNSGSRKTIGSKTLPKISIVNADDNHASFFAEFSADEHRSFSWTNPSASIRAQMISRSPAGATLSINDQPCFVPLIAPFLLLNVVAAIAAVNALGFDLKAVCAAAQALKPVPGRFEIIDCGQPFTVIVDYAYEPYALTALFKAVEEIYPGARLLGVHGSAGGGRDIARRPIIGALAAEHESVTIVTNEDPYDEDPETIIRQVAEGARPIIQTDSKKTLLTFSDRREAIFEAIKLAQAGDVVLITGKGSEPVMALENGLKAPWDDRQVARDALANLGYNREV